MSKNIKEELLEILRGEMKEMIMAEKSDHMSEMMPKPEGDEMTEVTVAGENPEAVAEGLSKAEQIMQAKMGGDSTEEAVEEVMEVDLDEEEIKKKQVIL